MVLIISPLSNLLLWLGPVFQKRQPIEQTALLALVWFNGRRPAHNT